MSPQFTQSVKRYIKEKHKPFKELVRKILGRNLKNGKYWILAEYKYRNRRTA